MLGEAQRFWQQATKSNAYSRRGAGRIALTAWYLGLLMGFGLALFLLTSLFAPFGTFLIFLGTFHMIEFLFVASFHPHNLSYDSFLVNHSVDFSIAMAVAIVEYFIELLIFPSLKQSYILYLGIMITTFGQLIRTVALFTAESNFTHEIAEEKRENHVLVTHGIYKYLRHPSYFGWFWWAMGTQLVLINPFCTLAYAAAAWTFFNKRIPYEESLLLEFFGDQYRNYCAKTPIRIPFISSAL